MKKYIALAIIVLAAAVTTGFAATLNCGPHCQIRCPDGGGCCYNYKTHVCTYFCNEHGVLVLQSKQPPDLGKGGNVSINFQNVSPKELKKALRQLGIL